MRHRWQRIWIRPGSYCSFSVPDPVSSDDADPDRILLITFKLSADVFQNIR